MALGSYSHINTLNPASYTGIDSLQVIFDTGVDGKISRFKSQGETARLNDANFSYLALAWRINHFIAAGFGLNPYSSTGYEINSSSLINGTQTEYPLNIIGSGDISRAYAGISVAPIQQLSLGFKTSFLFGNLKQTQYHDLAGFGITPVFNETTDYLHNFYFEFGAQYYFDYKNYTINLGATYNPGQKIVTRREHITSNETRTIYEEETENSTEFTIPEEFGVGIAVRDNKHFVYALDAGMQFWSDYDYNLSGVSLKNNPYVRTGLEYTPTTNFLAGFFKRVNYRAGFQYSKSYLNLRGTQLEEYTVSMGLGLPIRKDISRIDIAVELGSYGTTQNRLIEENYIRLRVGFSLKDQWFKQRKFN